MGMLYELDEVEKAGLLDAVLQRARADLNDGRPLTKMRDSGCTCPLHQLPESELVALIDRAIDATNAEIATHGGQLPDYPDNPFPLEHKPLRSLMEASAGDEDDDDETSD